MKDSIFLLLKVCIRTRYKSMHNAIAELQIQTKASISSTPNVEVLETKIIPLTTKN